MPASNRQFILRSRPKGLLAPGDLVLNETPIPELRDGEALARVKYFSIDPTMRIWMADIPQYMPPVGVGEVMRSAGLAEVIESRNSKFKKGDRIMGLTGLQEYVVLSGANAAAFQKLPKVKFISDTTFLGVLGITGITAYFGMMDIAKPKKGETLVVSAAAGATGSVVGQIGKIHGCRVVGIAGSDDKCKWIKEELGFDVAINYKQADWKAQLKAATPNGIDINFENVGGEIMQAVLDRMNVQGRVVLCGLISGYTKEDPAMASFGQVLMKSLKVQGFIVINYKRRYMEAVRRLAYWRWRGKLKDHVTVVEGIEKAPEAINMLFHGANMGKLVVKVAVD